jgi:signal recognition particle subunit SRP68
VKKAVTVENALDVKYLHILVFKTEGHWACGQSQKALAAKEENHDNSRLKFHAKKRFRLASLAAKELRKVAEGRLDQYSQVEVEAYVAYISANFLIEEKKFADALDNLIKAKIVYEKIAHYKDAIEAVIYEEKVAQIDTLIRLCSFNLNGMLDKKKEDEFIAKRMQGN